MPLTKSGAPSGPSRRSPSPDEAASAGVALASAMTIESSSRQVTNARLTQGGAAGYRAAARGRRRSAGRGVVLQRVVDRLQREIRLCHAEPVPILRGVRQVWT